MAALLDLPNELIIQILAGLTHQDLIACQLSNKLLNTTIKDSVLLQFQIALSTFKATNNPSCPLSLTKRLHALKDSEHAWTNLRKNFKQRIAVNHKTFCVSDLTGGVLLLKDASHTGLHYITLPSSIKAGLKWRKIQLDRSEGTTIISMRFCHEHDLLAVVTTTPRGATHAIGLAFFKVSTGGPHPAARESKIHVLDLRWSRPAINVEIVGDHLVFILSCRSLIGSPHDRVFVYEWRSAMLKMSLCAPCGTYTGLVFLSENLILIPNIRTNALEIWDIFSTRKTPYPSCILQLPELRSNRSLVKIDCRGKPNPIGSRSRIQSDVPFFQSANEAIILFHVRVRLGRPVTHFGGETVHVHTFTLLVHRNALCELYEQYCADMNGDLADDDSDVRDSVESNSHIGDDMSVRATDDDPTPVPWPSWVPPITCWLLTNSSTTEWINTTAGQRCVVVVRSPVERVGHYVVLDFNPDNVRRAGNTLKSLPLGVRRQIREYHEDTQGVFKDPVVGRLPFVARSSEELRGCTTVLIDEDRIICLTEDPPLYARIRFLEVHHFGGARG